MKHTMQGGCSDSLLNVVLPKSEIFVMHLGKIYNGTIIPKHNSKVPSIYVEELGFTFTATWNDILRALKSNDELIVL